MNLSNDLLESKGLLTHDQMKKEAIYQMELKLKEKEKNDLNQK